MKVSALKVGDRVENYRTGGIYAITAIAEFSGGGNGEITFDHVRLLAGLVPREITVRHRRMTFRQFENLKFLRREGDQR